jgi:hypothetical protein
MIQHLAGDICAWLAARSTERGGNPFGPMSPEGDPLDERAAMDGIDCGRRMPICTDADPWLLCQRCCEGKGYNRWA